MWQRAKRRRAGPLCRLPRRSSSVFRVYLCCAETLKAPEISKSYNIIMCLGTCADIASIHVELAGSSRMQLTILLLGVEGASQGFSLAVFHEHGEGFSCVRHGVLLFGVSIVRAFKRE